MIHGCPNCAPGLPCGCRDDLTPRANDQNLRNSIRRIVKRWAGMPHRTSPSQPYQCAACRIMSELMELLDAVDPVGGAPAAASDPARENLLQPSPHARTQDTEPE